MKKEHSEALIRHFKEIGVSLEKGLNDNEVVQVETKFDFKFPPDLRSFLQTALPISYRFVNWRQGLTSQEMANDIAKLLAWPLDGMLFDIENNNFWDDRWGSIPEKLEDKVSIATKNYKTYPKLIPIYSHRYIPAHPHKVGNPVFSIYQMDIIYYGYDLATYFAKEFGFELPDHFEIPERPILDIEFWSDWAG